MVKTFDKGLPFSLAKEFFDELSDEIGFAHGNIFDSYLKDSFDGRLNKIIYIKYDEKTKAPIGIAIKENRKLELIYIKEDYRDKGNALSFLETINSNYLISYTLVRDVFLSKVLPLLMKTGFTLESLERHVDRKSNITHTYKFIRNG